MRTPIDVDDELLVEAMARALASARTLSEFVEDTLRAMFAPRLAAPAAKALPVLRGRRLLPGVDLDCGATMLALMERDAG